MSIPEHLREKIQSIPEKPGIYKMKDCHGNIIYIGKSKSLSKRVKSYFYSSHKEPKIERLVFNIHDIDVIVTDTHLEAQLLECAMIKKYMPIYNSQFVRDKNYVYLKVEEKGNPLSICHIRDSKHTFGPFRSKYYLYDLIELFSKLYPISKVNNSFEFNYNALPITMNEKEFEENKKSLIDIFSNMDSLKFFLSILKSKMNEASKLLYFEKASFYRDLFLALNNLYKFQDGNISKDKDILTGEKLDCGYKLFYIYDGNLIMKKKFESITAEGIYEFIHKAQLLKNNRLFDTNEKRKMDFSSIINRELRNKYYEEINEEFKADEFIKRFMNN